MEEDKDEEEEEEEEEERDEEEAMVDRTGLKISDGWGKDAPQRPPLL